MPFLRLHISLPQGKRQDLDMETPDIGAAVLHGEPGQLRLTSTREALAQEQTVAGS